MRGARFLYDAPLDLVPSDALEAACPPVKACQDQEPLSLQDPLTLATSIHWPSDQTQLLTEAVDRKSRWLRLRRIPQTQRHHD
mmetsp:Transcript_310/g.408  ORF Transcript_310/g.408 Transcript_310/m.408 type:complete len:83 (-) Transcript_310:39-287(-)